MMMRMVLAAMVALSATAGAQISFQEHVGFAKAGKLGPRESAFAKTCGVDASTARIVNGRAVEETFKFVPVADVADGTDGQTDSYGSAQVFYVDGKARMANVWFAILDTGNYSDEMVCFDAGGKVTARETLNTNEPPGDEKDFWRHLERVTYAAGKPTIVVNEFVTSAGARVAVVPKLDKDSMFMATTQTPTETLQQVIAALPMKAK